jgi:hypothetical protein
MVENYITFIFGSVLKRDQFATDSLLQKKPFPPAVKVANADSTNFSHSYTNSQLSAMTAMILINEVIGKGDNVLGVR